MVSPLALRSDYFNQGLVSRDLRVLPVPEPEFEVLSPPYMQAFLNDEGIRKIAAHQYGDAMQTWRNFHKLAVRVLEFWCLGFAESEPSMVLSLIEEAHPILVSTLLLFIFVWSTNDFLCT